MFRMVLSAMVLIVAAQQPASRAGGKDDGGIKIDKDKKTITIDAKIAPRKLPQLKEVYPIEVIACWPDPKGKKAHETIVTIDALPSKVHKGLVELGLKPGAPVMGGEKDEPQGPEVKVYLELPQPDGETRRITIDKALVDRRNQKPFPKDVKWRFTGSVMSKPDPNKSDEVYGADLSGTLISIFPVTNQTVMQTNLTMQLERFMKLDTNTKVLPKEGTPVKLVLEVK